MLINRHHTVAVLLGLLVLLTISGCRDNNPDRHLRLGNWYLQRGLLEDSIVEFKEVIRILPGDNREMTRAQYDLLGQAHYNLALVYTKKGWWDFARQEAETCFSLQPTKEHYALVELIQQRRALEANPAGDS